MKIDRMAGIIMVLLERDQVNAKELAGMFEVSTRTVYRDLESITQAGIPVVAVSGPGNGISILKSYKAEIRRCSTDEIAALLMGLGSIQRNLASREITTALAKVKGMSPYEKQSDFHDEPVTEVTLRVHKRAVDRIITRFGEGCVSCDGSEHYLANIRLPVSDLSVRYLLSFGTDCVCISPAGMKHKMREALGQIGLLYEKN